MHFGNKNIKALTKSDLVLYANKVKLGFRLLFVAHAQFDYIPTLLFVNYCY